MVGSLAERRQGSAGSFYKPGAQTSPGRGRTCARARRDSCTSCGLTVTLHPRSHHAWNIASPLPAGSARLGSRARARTPPGGAGRPWSPSARWGLAAGTALRDAPTGDESQDWSPRAGMSWPLNFQQNSVGAATLLQRSVPGAESECGGEEPALLRFGALLQPQCGMRWRSS